MSCIRLSSSRTTTRSGIWRMSASASWSSCERTARAGSATPSSITTDPAMRSPPPQTIGCRTQAVPAQRRHESRPSSAAAASSGHRLIVSRGPSPLPPVVLSDSSVRSVHAAVVINATRRVLEGPRAWRGGKAREEEERREPEQPRQELRRRQERAHVPDLNRHRAHDDCRDDNRPLSRASRQRRGDERGSHADREQPAAVAKPPVEGHRVDALVPRERLELRQHRASARQHRVDERHRMPEMRERWPIEPDPIDRRHEQDRRRHRREKRDPTRRAPCREIARVHEPGQQQQRFVAEDRSEAEQCPCDDIRAALPPHRNDKRPRGSRQRDGRFAGARRVEPERRRKRDDRRKAPSRTAIAEPSAACSRERAAGDRQRTERAGAQPDDERGQHRERRRKDALVLTRAAEHERRLEWDEQPVGIDPLAGIGQGHRSKAGCPERLGLDELHRAIDGVEHLRLQYRGTRWRQARRRLRPRP